MIQTLATVLLPIFAVLGLGVLAGRSGRIAPTQVGPLNTLVMDFTLPAALLGAVARTSRAELVGQWRLMLVLAAGLLLLWGVVYLLQRRVRSLPSGPAAVLAISIALPNFAAAGVPLMAAMFDGIGGLQIAVAITLGAVVLSPLTLILLDLEKGRRTGSTLSAGAAFAAAARRVSRAPLILAPLFGVLLVLLGIALPVPLLRAIALLGQASGGVALFLTGLVLSARRVTLSRWVLAGVLLANLVHPLLTAALVPMAALPPQPARAAVLLSALPSGFFGIFFALRYEEEAGEAASIVALSTVASIASLSLAILFTAS